VKLVHWVVTAPLALVFVIFAVANRDVVSLSFWPLPIELRAPVWAVVLLTLLAGFLIGEFVAWINGRRWRRQAREKARRVEALERELAAKTQAKEPAKELSRT
jgi:putative membrane protein